MDDSQCKQLDEQGYLVFKRVLAPEEIETVLIRPEELWVTEGEHAGKENYMKPGVRRLANLANKGEILRKLSAHTQVLEVVEAVMGSDVRASMVNAQDMPHTGVRMPFHMDSDRAATLSPHERELLGLDDE